MQIERAKELLATLAESQRDALETAHWRYMCFAGVLSIDEASDKQAQADRIAYSHLLKFTEDGKPLVSDERTADFMSAVSGLPREWCLAWDEQDFYNTHGVSSEEAIARGAV